jgi:serine/threonine-protein kinase RsbW
MQAEAVGGTLSLNPPDRARIVMDATMLDVRQSLRDLMASPLVRNLSADCLGTTELVLAEALNNVVEHAYARYPGQIEVEVQRHLGHLRFRIADQGLPMPDGKSPKGKNPKIAAVDDLPEGGFGWFLIRSFAEGLAYRRFGKRNMLSFGVSVDIAV